MTPLRVLVVGDVAALRHKARRLLAEAGHEVVGETAEGRAGVAMTLARSPDLVIVDHHMPDLDGVEATHRIRTSSPDVYVIAFSSANHPGAREAFLAGGASAYHDKRDLAGLRDSIAQIADLVSRRPRASSLEVTVRAWPALARAHVALRGALTANTRERLTGALAQLPDASGEVTLDLSDVTAIDAAGAAALADYRTAAQARGVELILQDPSPVVRRGLARHEHRA